MRKSIIVNNKLIDKLAKLANLPLSSTQKKKLPNELKSILEYAAKIQDTNTKNVTETAQVTGLTNITRQDKLDKTQNLSQKQALSNAKKVFNNYFVVPVLIDHES